MLRQRGSKVRLVGRGLGGCRGTGAWLSGEYVVFLDSDDRLVSGALEVGK